MVTPLRPGDPGHPGELREPAPGQPLHHLPCLVELLQQDVHVADRGPTASGDPRPAAAADDSGVAPLLRGHRGDDGLGPADLPLVDLHVRRHLGPARQHAEEVLQRAELPYFAQLGQEVLQREPVLGHPLGGFAGLLLVHGLLGLLHEGKDVPHPQDPRGHPIRMERLQVPRLLSYAGEVDRPSSHLRHRERSAAAGGWRSAATSMGRRPFSRRCSASFAHAVVFPDPCRPAIITTAGSAEGRTNGRCFPPSVSVSSSPTIFTTCWPGVTDRMTSSPIDRPLTRSRNESATSTATSASRRAALMSSRAASTCFGWSLPRDLSFLNTAPKRSLSCSNIGQPVYRGGRRAQPRTRESANDRGSNGWRSPSFSPVATNFTGSPRSSRTDRTIPPRAVPSIFVSTTPVTPTASANARACASPFCPVVASSTRSTSSGGRPAALVTTRSTLASSSISGRFECNLPAVSTISTSRPRARAASTASKATAPGSAPRS